MICKNCGKTINDDSAFCSYCGTKVENCCPSCGAVLMAGALFCSKCGTSVSSAPAPKPAAPVSNPFAAFAPKPAAAPAPRTEPFFKKWIEENKDFADSNYFNWISEFVNGYAITVNGNGYVKVVKEVKSGSGFGEYKTYEVLEYFGNFDLSYQCNPEASGNKTSGGTFYNGLKYFAFNIIPKLKDESFDNEFLNAFGGVTKKDLFNTGELEFSGIVCYDGSFVKTMISYELQKGYFSNPFVILNENFYVELDIDNIDPQKEFLASKFIRLDTGETVLSDVHFDALSCTPPKKDALVVIPRNEKIKNYKKLFCDRYGSADYDNRSPFFNGYAGLFLYKTKEGKLLSGKNSGFYEETFYDCVFDEEISTYYDNRTVNRGKDIYVYYDNVVKQGEELCGYPVILDHEGKLVLKMDKQKFRTYDNGYSNDHDYRWDCTIYAGCMGYTEYYFIAGNCDETGDDEEPLTKTYLYTRSRGSSSAAKFVKEFSGNFCDCHWNCHYFDGEDKNNFQNGTIGFIYNGNPYPVVTLYNIYDPKKQTRYDQVLILSEKLEPVAELLPGAQFIIAGGKLYATDKKEDRLGVTWHKIRCLNDNKEIVKVSGSDNYVCLAISSERRKKIGNTYWMLLNPNEKFDEMLVSLSGKVVLNPGDFMRYFNENFKINGGRGWDLEFADDEIQNDPSVPANSIVMHKEEYDTDGHNSPFYFIVSMNGNITGPFDYSKDKGFTYAERVSHE